MSFIVSGQNKAVKQIKSLATRSNREKNGLFVIEGIRSVCDAINKGADVKYIIVKEGFSNIPDVKCPIHVLEEKLFSCLSDTCSPQGIMAVCNMKKDSIEDIKYHEKDVVVVCENIQDPGNLGTIIRSADAAGVKGVILTKGCVDLYNPKVVRSTMSSIFSIPIITDVSISETCDELKKRGFKVVCGALNDSAVDLFDADLEGQVAVVVGNEGNGLSDEAIECADIVAKIPMRGGAESLNVAIACSVMVYEHLRRNRREQ